MSPRPKLTISQIGELRAAKAADPSLTNDALGTRFGVNASTVSRALADAPPARIDPAPAGDREIVPIDLALLMPSPLNPRRTFSEESIAELAETIADKGLLQNLMVRKPKESGYVAVTDSQGATHPGFYEIVFGERRYRALQLLAKQGRWDKAVSCIIADIDDATHLALATIENVQREDVPPLEEAEGLARLHAMDPQDWSTQAIADRIGRTQRYVQQRIAMANNLAPAAKILFREKLLTVEAARDLAAESVSVQMEVLNDLLDTCDFPTMDEILDTDADIDWLSYEALNTEAIGWSLDNIHERQRREKEQAARDAAPAPQSEMRLDNASAAEPRARANNGPAAAPAPLAEPEPKAGPAVTKTHIYHAHNRKSFALQNALSHDLTNSLRVACMALLGPQSVTLIVNTPPKMIEDWPGENKSIEATIKRILCKAKPPEYIGDGKAEKLWLHLETVQAHDLDSLFCALIARRVHTSAGCNALLGDDPLAVAIADSLSIAGNEEKHGLALQNEDLAGLRKPILLAIADETGTPGVNDSTKVSELIGAIEKERKRNDYVIPTLRFGNTKQLEKSLKEMGK